MDTFERKIAAWAETRSEIRTILVVGSYARTNPPPDQWADLDVHLFCTDIEHLIADKAWLENIGEVWTWLPEQIEDIPQLLVLFEGGAKVDFGFFPLEVIEGFIAAQSLDEVHDRGYYILLDKDGLAAHLPAPSNQPRRKESPSEERFLQVVNTFFYGAVYVAKQIRRRNLWVVKFRDWTMKQQLLLMMEWYAHVLHGPELDTFYDGHFIYAWIDTQTWNALYHAFGGFSAPGSWKALFETMEIFRRLASKTGLVLGYTYPSGLDRKTTAYVEYLYQNMEK